MSEIIRRSKKYHLTDKDIEVFRELLKAEIGNEAVKKMTYEDIISAACFFLSITVGAYDIAKRKQRRLIK